MNIGRYPFEVYVDMVKSFHGSIAPGMIIGGFMVDLALNNTPEGEFFDAICETPNCLPDAIQLLTPCTTGNGWLKVVNLGRFALTLYEKYSGEGVRVFLDSARVDAWPEIKSWYFKLKPKMEQNSLLLLEQIREAGPQLYSIQRVTVKPQLLKKRSKGQIAVCPLCKEAYPARDGDICLGCQGDAPYLETDIVNERRSERGPFLEIVPAVEAMGRRVLHDMTRIIPENVKGPAFKHGHTITVEDIDILKKMGRKNIYVEGQRIPGQEWVHEDEAALTFARAMAGDGVTFTEVPSEGKVTLLAERDGLLVVDEDRLEIFNLVPGVMCASRQSFSVVNKGGRLAGTRAIPLFLQRINFNKAQAVLGSDPLFKVLPMHRAWVGILVTGTEVFQGLVKDSFTTIIRTKLEKLGCQEFQSVIVPDDRMEISRGIKKLLDSNIDLLVTTGGLSVDPDDLTRQGLIEAGAVDILYGAPVLPGAMTLLASIGAVQVIGVPAGALYYETTSFDLLVPRLLAGLTITRHDLARLSHGAFCLECKKCTFPQCPFGR